MEATISARGLRKRYGHVEALAGLDLDIRPGEVFGLLGPNGSGKSTTLACLLGIRRPDGGRAAVLGIEPRGGRRELFRRVGVQFQDPAWPDKIRVGEACAVNDTLHRLTAGASAALLADFGLGGRSGTPVSALSGGERQRLALVQALAHRPEAVFLDELTTGLDPEARQSVWERLREINARGATIFLTSHSMEEVEALCTRVALLRGGRAVFDGSPAELKARTGRPTLEQAYLAQLKEEIPA